MTGCVVGPNYKRPAVSAPPTIRGAAPTAEQASFADLPWWEVFKEPTLQELVKTALANNYDLKIAVSRVEQARQIAAQARSQYFPAVGYQGGVGGGKNEFVGNVSPASESTQGSVLLAASAAWEPDIWGRIRRLNESGARPVPGHRRGQARSAADPGQRRGASLLRACSDWNCNSRSPGNRRYLVQETVKLFTQRFQGGVSSMLDVSRAQAAEATVAANIPELERQIALKENQISVLLGQNPTRHPAHCEAARPDRPARYPGRHTFGPAGAAPRHSRRRGPGEVRQCTDRCGAGGVLSEDRPDCPVRARERPARELHVRQIQHLVLCRQFRRAHLPGGLLKAQKRQAIAAWEQAKLQYEQTALNAFQDVSNALISRQKFDATPTEQIRAVQAYEQSVEPVDEALHRGQGQLLRGPRGPTAALPRAELRWPLPNSTGGW